MASTWELIAQSSVPSQFSLVFIIFNQINEPKSWKFIRIKKVHRWEEKQNAEFEWKVVKSLARGSVRMSEWRSQSWDIEMTSLFGCLLRKLSKFIEKLSTNEKVEVDGKQTNKNNPTSGHSTLSETLKDSWYLATWINPQAELEENFPKHRITSILERKSLDSEHCSKVSVSVRREGKSLINKVIDFHIVCSGSSNISLVGWGKLLCWILYRIRSTKASRWEEGQEGERKGFRCVKWSWNS